MRKNEGVSILVVDDDPNSLDIVRTYLEARGYKVATAADGKEALSRLEEVRPGLEAVYGRFAELNTRLLALCTVWQLRVIGDERVVNDHHDPRYDEQVVSSLKRFDRDAAALCGELGSLLERFRRYLPRLERALDHVRVGQHEWFASPIVDSYHGVWFELHEDLLATLGIERATEGVAS